MAAMHPLVALYNAGITNMQQAEAARQAAALQGIAKLRAAGYSDADWRAMTPDQIIAIGAGGNVPMALAGGTELLGPAVTKYGMDQQYRLGRGALAMDLARQNFAEKQYLSEVAQNPFNVVQYLELMGQTGQRLPLMDRAVTPIKPVIVGGGRDPEEERVRRFLGDEGDTFAGGGRKTIGPGAYVETDGDIAFTAGEEGPETVEITPRRGNPRRTTHARRRGIINDVKQRTQPPAQVPVGERTTPIDASLLTDTGPDSAQPQPAAGVVRQGKPTPPRKKNRGLIREHLPRAFASGGQVSASSWASDQQKKRDIARLAATPGAAEAFAAHDARTARQKIGTTSGLTSDRAQQGDPNNLVIRYGPDGRAHVDQSTDTNQRGSVVYNSDGTRRPATQADIDAANKADLDYARANVSGSGQGHTPLKEFAAQLKYHGGINSFSKAVREGRAESPYEYGQYKPEYRNYDGDVPHLEGQAAPSRGRRVAEGRASENDQRREANMKPNFGGKAPSRFGGAGKGGGVISQNGGSSSGGSNTGGDSSGSLSSAARLVANAVRNLPAAPPEVVTMLEAGQVPGISQIAPIWHLLLPSEKQAFAALYSGTGQLATVQDIEELVDRQRAA